MRQSSIFSFATAFMLILIIVISFFSITANVEVVTDVTGPTITEVYCDKQEQVLQPGDSVYFSFKAYDESDLQDGVSVNFFEAASYGGRGFD